MNCDSARQILSLYLYGELEFPQEEELEQHVEACPPCSTALDRERTRLALLDQFESHPSPELLQACRRELRSSIAKTQAQRNGRWQWLADWLDGVSLWKPIGAIVLVAVGFFGARLWDTARAHQQPAILRVRALQPTPQGTVQLVLEEVRQKVVRGDLDDRQIRTMLFAAAADPNDAGLRARSLDILKEQCQRPDVRQVLLRALRTDPNPGVRLKALDALKPFAAEPDTRRALSDVLLADENAGIRTMAIDLLTGDMNTETIGALQELIIREDNPYIRQKSLKALRQVNASVETF